MKNIFVTVFLASLTVILSHCSSPKNAIGRKGKTTIQNLLILPVYSDIHVIEKNDKGTKSELRSAATEGQIIVNLENQIPGNVEKTFLNCNDLQKTTVLDTSVQFMERYRKSRFPNSVKSPKLLFAILDSLNKDYGLFVFHGGFTRTPENFKSEYIRRHNLRLYSLGFYDTTLYNSYSLMLCMLLERKSGKVVKYKELKWPNKDPSAEIVIWAQVQDLISSFFQ